MSSRLGGARRFHPDLRAGSRLLPRAAVSPRLVPWIRKAIARLPVSPDFVETQVSDTAAIRVYRPAHAPTPSPALLYIHGGGLLIGSPVQDEPVLRAIADELGVVVATVRYRLAPEHRFPGSARRLLRRAVAGWPSSRGSTRSGSPSVAGVPAAGSRRRWR